MAGYAFFAHFGLLGLREAWSMFRDKNGDPDELRFRTPIGGYRKGDLRDPRTAAPPLGCTILPGPPSNSKRMRSLARP